MTQQDVLFMVMIGIGLAALTIVAIQLLKPRRKDDGGEWYEGPWDDDDRPRNPR